ncbi:MULTISPECIES: helix-turn-helix domain-containing protein [unclassified Streptomyces]|uniref:MarR family winged helix-turn-helix transcriptional regulator n=1 Tax=unclassified Streptomyces TaxID=2593676 RepID=UPI0023662CA9|nr:MULTISPECIES: helix-turn-helix domain-containing protein [unclassified Streptomyces]MDF3146209.1 helix-turn-helix domain-containing protein [Streptomyces sp. T21Q-yed]WDF38106.1 helix-turn-helix domain-containing protein [Streptomyces sp. T12]
MDLIRSTLVGVNGVELFLLGRALMKIGEEALPEPPGGVGRYAGSTRLVLVVASDIAGHPDSAVGEIAARTGLPQSQVSAAVARLKEAGSVHTVPDPTDRRRVLVRPAGEVSERVAQVRATGIEKALAAALGSDDRQRLREVTEALNVLARNLAPTIGAHP